MGQKLLAEEPVFRTVIEACDRAIQQEAGWSLLAELAAGKATSQLGRIDVVQPVLFAIEVALAALWRSWGIEPGVVVGHSMGEVAAACVAGALSLEDAVAIVCRRSRLLCRIRGQGEMAMVELSLADATAALSGYEDRLSVAVSNSPRSTVLSGEPAALGEVLSALSAKGVFCQQVKVDVASHSPQVDPLRADLLESLEGLRPRRTTVPMRSTVTGAVLEGTELGSAYWADNLREPVRFAEAVQAVLKSDHGLFVEMSPHPILAPAIDEIQRAVSQEGAVVGSLRWGRDERQAMLESLGALWVRGHAMSWERLFPAGGRRVPLPTYAWQRERHWPDAPANGASGSRRRGHAGGHPLLGEGQTLSTQVGTRLWETTLDLQRLPWLVDHRIQDTAVFPGTGYLEMALVAGAETFGDRPFQITGVSLAQALAFTDETTALVQTVTTEQEPGRLRFQIATLAPGADRASWRVHGHGTLQQVERAEAIATLDLGALRDRLGAAVPGPTVYAKMTAMGIDYGPAFQGMVTLWRGEGEGLVQVRLPAAAGSAAPYRLHPALLDACLQGTLGVSLSSSDTTPWVPVEVGSLRAVNRPAGELWCHVRSVGDGSQRSSPRSRRRFDVKVVDGTGAAVVDLSGLVLQRLPSRVPRREEDGWFLEIDWEPAPVPAPRLTAGRWLLLGGGDGLGAALGAELQASGHTVVHAAAHDTSVAGVGRLLKEAFGGQPPTAVVHLGGLEAGRELDAESLETALARGYDSVLSTVQALAGMVYRDAPRLWLVTRGAQAVAGGEVLASQAPLVGLGRTIALEHADLRCARVDLDPNQPDGEISPLLAELLADDAEDEVALRGSPEGGTRASNGDATAAAKLSGSAGGGERRVARLVRRAPEAGRSKAVLRDGSYLVTGGLGGLGLRVAGWLADKGAGHLVLVGRSGAASAEQQAAVAALEARGARVTVAKANVAVRAQMEYVLVDIAASGMPLRGVIHAAGVQDNGLLLHQTPARLRAFMAPRILGALHLHALTRDLPLDFFVLYASASGLLGSPGQSNHAAASTFLDALAHHRKRQGLPALSIDWGAFSEVSQTAAQENHGGARLDSRGMRILTPDEGLSALARLFEDERTQVGVMPLELRHWVELYPTVAASRLLSRLRTPPNGDNGQPAGDRDLLDRLAAAEPAERAALIEQALCAQVSQVLRILESKLDVDAPFTSLGMDSLIGLELRNRVEVMLGITVPATLLWTYPTIATLSAHLAGKVRGGASPEPPPVSLASTEADIEDMSQDELERLIDEKYESLA